MPRHEPIFTMRRVARQHNIAPHLTLFATLQRVHPALFVSPLPPILILPDPEFALRDRLLFAVSKLPEPQRHIVLMRLVGELSVDDIAAKLRVSRDSVVDVLSAARLSMKRYLELVG